MKNETTLIEKTSFNFPVQLLKTVDANGEFHIVGYAATSDLDLQGDIISDAALQASSLDLLQNSTVLLNHDVTQPIGKVTKVQFDQHGLLIDALISQTEPDIIQKIKEGVLNKFSIRGQVLERQRKFMPDLNRAVNVILRMTLVEVSLVSVPANPEARAIGWYVSKALNELDQKSKGGIPMPEEQVIVEEIKPEAPAPAAAAAAPAPTPEISKSEPAKPAEPALPAAAPALPAAAPMVEKAMPQPMMAQLAPIWALLDQIAALGEPAAPLAKQVAGMLRSALMSWSPAQPAAKSMSKDDLGKMIAGEVAKQVETALKSVPTVRKGLVQPEDEAAAADARKQFEGLTPEKKLRVALAMQKA